MIGVEKELLTTGDVARHCKVSYVSVLNWIRTGKLKAHKTPGGHCRIKLRDFVKFLEKHDMPVPEELSRWQEKRVLVVDDEPAIVDFICDALRLDEYNYRIESASDGYSAAMQVLQFKPDLIILDIRMPGLDGIDVCRQIKSNPDTKNIKILAITGVADDEEVEEILRCGAAHCLSKPLQLNDLRNWVARILKIYATPNYLMSNKMG